MKKEKLYKISTIVFAFLFTISIIYITSFNKIKDSMFKKNIIEVQITSDNWQDFFEEIDYGEKLYDDWDEKDYIVFHSGLKIKDDYYDKLAKESVIQCEFTFLEGNVKLNYNKETKSYKIIDTYLSYNVNQAATPYFFYPNGKKIQNFSNMNIYITDENVITNGGDTEVFVNVFQKMNKVKGTLYLYN